MMFLCAIFVVFALSVLGSIVFTIWTVESNSITTVYKFPEDRDFCVNLMMLSGSILLIFSFIAQI